MAHIFTILLALCILQSATALGSADIIFLGNNIVTVDADNPAARAIAVKGTRILAVGTEAEVLLHKGASTRIIKLGDRALVPGFIDAHTHDDFAALTHPDMAFKTRGGVTTCIVGNCGFGAAPFEASGWG